METHLERAHAPGQWTTRQVLCHLLFEPGFRPTGLLECFTATDLPLIEIIPGVATVTAERGRMTLAELTAALDAQRRQVFAYLGSASRISAARRASRCSSRSSAPTRSRSRSSWAPCSTGTGTATPISSPRSGRRSACPRCRELARLELPSTQPADRRGRLRPVRWDGAGVLVAQSRQLTLLP
jgi:hypothetical protein